MVDLHVHSTASDGHLSPEAVVARAAAVGLAAIALTDHDTVDGVAPALVAGQAHGVRVVSACEFSAAASWGEMHVLGYFLPHDSEPLGAFLEHCRLDRTRRARDMVARLQVRGYAITFDDVLTEAQGGAVGRPHVARAMVRRGVAASVTQAFERYIGRGRPAFVEKTLPSFAEVANVIHAAGGVVSVAHLKDRGSLSVLERLKSEGLDAVETRHPSHNPDIRAHLTDLALQLGLVRTGGSDWHGDTELSRTHGDLGSQQVPLEWLEQLEEKTR